MTDRDVRELLGRIDAPVEARPGFKEELGDLLVRELGPDEADAGHILRLIRGPVDRRPAFRAELAATLAHELAGAESGPAARGGPVVRRPLARLGNRLRSGWWQSAAAAVILAIVASGTAWTSCLQSGVEPKQRLTVPEAGLEAGERFRPGADEREDPAPNDPKEPGDDSGPPSTVPAGDAPADPADPPTGGPPPPPGNPAPPTGEGQDLGILAFASKAGGTWDIFTMREDGTRRSRLTSGPGHDREPAWSPDGSKIAFVRLEREFDRHGQIYVMNADGSGPGHLVAGGEPHWSPDGRQIAYSSPHPASIWVIDADGTDAHRISQAGVALDPAWSPDGDLISVGAGMMVEADAAKDVYRATNVYTMRPDGSEVRRLTDEPYACNTSFSPDGSRIAYVVSKDVISFHVWTMRPDGSDKTQVTRGGGVRAFPHWSPDGRRIVFGLDPDGESHWVPVALTAGPAPSALWIIDTDGSNPRRISPPGVNDADPVFRPEPRRKSAGTSDE